MWPYFLHRYCTLGAHIFKFTVITKSRYLLKEQIFTLPQALRDFRKIPGSARLVTERLEPGLWRKLAEQSPIPCYFRWPYHRISLKTGLISILKLINILLLWLPGGDSIFQHLMTLPFKHFIFSIHLSGAILYLSTSLVIFYLSSFLILFFLL